MDLSSLNDNQRLAVTTTEGPVMVMAGAGSGKTKVLTTRIAYLINECAIPKENILAVTFTNKAANEMKERISNLIDDETANMWISTFHSFCSRILRYEITKLGYTRFFSIVDEEDSLKIIKEIVKENDLDEEPKYLKKMISHKKNNGKVIIKNPIKKDIFDRTYDLYNDYLKNNNLLDFDDLLLKTIELFEDFPNVLEYYQKFFQYILVDEFQDTNEIQYKLMMMLAFRHTNLFVVGDDFQSIYAFRGAKIENIHKFLDDYKTTKLILLEKNYRSTTEILNLANEIIRHNPNQIEKTLTSNNKKGKLPLYRTFDRDYEEVNFIIDRIKKLLLNGFKYKDIAVIYRANYLSRIFEDKLLQCQIPYKIYGNISFYARAEIKDITAYLKLIINPNDDFAFQRVVNVPKRKVGPTTILKLKELQNDNHKSLFEEIDLVDHAGLKNFKKTILKLQEEFEHLEDNSKIIDIIVTETGYFEELKRLNDEEVAEDKKNNVLEFKSLIKQYEFHTDNKLEALEEMLYDMALKSEHDDATDEDSITLSTYHQVKGLEFEAVFLVALEERIFPSINAITNEDIEEERRVFYVGVTRAKSKLYLTNVKDRMLFGGHTRMIPSRFIDEIDEKFYTDGKKPTAARKKKVVNTIDSGGSGFSAGDIINHEKFGFGVLIKVMGDEADIAFKAEFGIKHLKLNHPAIKVIKKKNA